MNNVVRLPTGRERMLRNIRQNLNSTFQGLVDEPMCSEAIEDIMRFANQYLLPDPVSLTFHGNFTEDQKASLQAAVDAFVNPLRVTMGEIVGEFIGLRMAKATCQMLHGDFEPPSNAS